MNPSMRPKNRVYSAINFRETDIIPYNVFIDDAVALRLDTYYGGRDKWPKYEDHMVRILWNLLYEDLGNGFYRDKFGVIWEKNNAMCNNQPLLKEPDLKGLYLPELISDEDIKKIKAICRQNDDKFIYYQFTGTFFERGWALRGMETFLIDLVLYPRFAEELLENLLQLHLDAIRKLVKLPIDGITFGDDYGSQKGLLISPNIWRKYFRDRLKIMFSQVRDGGKIVGLHSCGDNTEIMSDLVDIGLQIFHPLQQEAMDIKKIKKEYGRHLTFRGGIGTQGFITFGQPKKIVESMRRCVDILRPGGGYIIETGKPLMDDVPTENAAVVLETLIKLTKNG